MLLVGIPNPNTQAAGFPEVGFCLRSCTKGDCTGTATLESWRTSTLPETGVLALATLFFFVWPSWFWRLQFFNSYSHHPRELVCFAEPCIFMNKIEPCKCQAPIKLANLTVGLTICFTALLMCGLWKHCYCHAFQLVGLTICRDYFPMLNWSRYPTRE